MKSKTKTKSLKTGKPQFFFGDRLKRVAAKIKSNQDNLDLLNNLSRFEKTLDSRVSAFENLFFRASPKLKTILLHNPHLQTFLMGAKPAVWISFEEMFPGEIENWLYLLKVKNLFFEKSVSVVLDEIVRLKPNLIKLREDLVVDLTQAKEVISHNLDIFAEFRNTPYVVVTTEEVVQIVKKIALNIEMGRIPQMRNMLGILLGYPRKQVLQHKIIDKLDMQILIPRLNDFSRYGFHRQTLLKEKDSAARTKLNDIFNSLQQWEIDMNEKATSFDEQQGIHTRINLFLKEHQAFLREMIFKHYFLKGLSQKAADTVDNYILLSFPRLAFPGNLDFVDFGMFWVEYLPDQQSRLIKAKILLAVKKVSQWKKRMRIK